MSEEFNNRRRDDKYTFDGLKQMLIKSRGELVEILDLALMSGDITSKERNVMYFRMIEWNSLESTGKEFGVTRERIRQIEAKVGEIMRVLTE